MAAGREIDDAARYLQCKIRTIWRDLDATQGQVPSALDNR
jgi:hypothetical protein